MKDIKAGVIESTNPQVLLNLSQSPIKKTPKSTVKIIEVKLSSCSEETPRSKKATSQKYSNFTNSIS